MFNLKKCLQEIFCCCFKPNTPRYTALYINPGELIVDVIELAEKTDSF